MPLIEFANGAFAPQQVTHIRLGSRPLSTRRRHIVQVHLVDGKSMEEADTDEVVMNFRFEQIKKQIENGIR